MKLLREIPAGALNGFYRLNPDTLPVYYAEYSDGCFTIRGEDGSFQWVGQKHTPHYKFSDDQPVAYWVPVTPTTKEIIEVS